MYERELALLEAHGTVVARVATRDEMKKGASIVIADPRIGNLYLYVKATRSGITRFRNAQAAGKVSKRIVPVLATGYNDKIDLMRMLRGIYKAQGAERQKAVRR